MVGQRTASRRQFSPVGPRDKPRSFSLVASFSFTHLSHLGGGALLVLLPKAQSPCSVAVDLNSPEKRNEVHLLSDKTNVLDCRKKGIEC